jgi:hypothetical protein
MDIQFLINEAQTTMLAQGSVMPMIYLELTNNLLMIALDILSDTQSIPVQCGILARLGWEECKKYPGQKPVSIGFYSEAWRVKDAENTETEMRPVRSPKRQEIISVSFWQADKEPHAQSCVLLVIRDHKKRVIDIQEEEIKEKLSYQLASFRQGVLDSQKPDEEVFGNLERAIGKGIAKLSPEQRLELMDLLQQEGLL